jgi:hypothetical protein
MEACLSLMTRDKVSESKITSQDYEVESITNVAERTDGEQLSKLLARLLDKSSK